jgi:hypothetical protein
MDGVILLSRIDSLHCSFNKKKDIYLRANNNFRSESKYKYTEKEAKLKAKIDDGNERNVTQNNENGDDDSNESNTSSYYLDSDQPKRYLIHHEV